MNPEVLVRMANQIATFFESMPNRADAVTSCAEHLRLYWAPAMRRQLAATLESDGSTPVHTLIRDAVTRHKEVLVTPPERTPMA